MTPEEKSQELVDLFQNMILDVDWEEKLFSGRVTPLSAKICALKIVDEILQFMEDDDNKHDCCYYANSSWMKYWEEVKKEINEL